MQGSQNKIIYDAMKTLIDNFLLIKMLLADITSRYSRVLSV